MALGNWARVLLTATGAGLLAATGQLGVAYGLGVVRLARTFEPTARDEWTAQVAWVVWLAMAATVVGTLVGHRQALRYGGGAGPGAMIAVTVCAAVGAAAVAPLAMAPALDAVVPSVRTAPVVGLSVLIGVLVAALAGLMALVERAVRWNVAATLAGGWLLALVSVAPSLGPADPQVVLRLGVLEPAWLPPGLAARTAVVTMPALALVAGAVVGWVARGRGTSPAAAAVCGLSGPALLAAAYLIAGPGNGAGRLQDAPYWGAVVAVAAGLLGSVLAVVVQRSDEARREPDATDPDATDPETTDPATRRRADRRTTSPDPDPRSPDPRSPDPRSPSPGTPHPHTPGPVSPGQRTPDPSTPGQLAPGQHTRGPRTPEPATAGQHTRDPRTPEPRAGGAWRGGAPSPDGPSPTTMPTTTSSGTSVGTAATGRGRPARATAAVQPPPAHRTPPPLPDAVPPAFEPTPRQRPSAFRAGGPDTTAAPDPVPPGFEPTPRQRPSAFRAAIPAAGDVYVPAPALRPLPAAYGPPPGPPPPRRSPGTDAGSWSQPAPGRAETHQGPFDAPETAPEAGPETGLERPRRARPQPYVPARRRASGAPATGTPTGGTPTTGGPAGGTPTTGTPSGGTPAAPLPASPGSRRPAAPADDDHVSWIAALGQDPDPPGGATLPGRTEPGSGQR